ncbi:MAG: CAP domain-containing protein [bacterium]
MTEKLKKWLYFYLIKPKIKYKLSLLSALIGIFLLPNLAYLSSISPEEIIALTNKEREQSGLNSLTANQLLTQAAIEKGKSILESQTFQHSIGDRKFSSWVRESGYNYSYTGENLAIDFTSSQDIIEAWKNSPSHKKNLLSSSYQEIGVSVIEGKFQNQDTSVVVQIFGSPAAGSASLLSKNTAQGLIKPNTNFLKTEVGGYKTTTVENLLTHSILDQELLSDYGNKLALPEVNKIIVQRESSGIGNNFLMIFSSLALSYLLLFLHCRYFSEISKLASL